MSDFLVAYFHTETEATSFVEKLSVYGIKRDHVTLHGEDLSLRSATPEHSLASGSGDDTDTEKPYATNPDITDPDEDTDDTLVKSLAGHAVLTVEVPGKVSVNEVCIALKDAGAYLIDVTENNIPQQYPYM